MQAKNAKNYKLKLGAILIGVLISVLAIELGARIYLFGVDAFSYRKLRSFVSLLYSGHTTTSVEHPPHIQLKPNRNGYFKLLPFSTNMHAMRDKHYDRIKPSNTIRGVAIGDSYTMGTGVAMENIYHSLLEDYLNEIDTVRTHEILNVGVSGYDLLDYRQILKNRALAFDPDYIIIGFCSSNDLKERKRSRWDLEAVDIKVRNGFFVFYTQRIVENIIRPKGVKKSDVRSIAFADRRFREFAEISQQMDIPILINYMSVRNQKKTYKAVRELSDQHNLYFAHSTDLFDYDNQDIYQFNYLDPHPNFRGHQLYFEGIIREQQFMELILGETSIYSLP